MKKKKGLYLCKQNYSFDSITVNSVGVAKKILSQFEILNMGEFESQFINFDFSNRNYLMLYFSFFLFKKNYIKNADFKNLDFVYIRRFSPNDRNFIYMLESIKRLNTNCRIIYEIPTYPYDQEHRGIKGFFLLLVDRWFRRYLKKYIDYIATYSTHDEIFGIKTLKIINGINCSSIPIINSKIYHEDLHLICVAQFSSWHGYDRLIEGLNFYYKAKVSRNVFISFVGDGPDLGNYKRNVIEYGLSDYISFHGLLSGEDLDSVFNRADLAVGSLGGHRKGIFLSSELKSREYMARGIPMIASTKIDVLNNLFPYIHYVPEDDSPIDIQKLISFYDNLTQKESKEEQVRNIRRFAEVHCDMAAVMQPIIEAIG